MFHNIINENYIPLSHMSFDEEYMRCVSEAFLKNAFAFGIVNKITSTNKKQWSECDETNQI